MEKNHNVVRKVYDSIYANLAENFLNYMSSLDSNEINGIRDNMFAKGLGQRLEQNFGTYDLLTVFDFFYYVNGRFPSTTGHLYVPDGEKPREVEGENINIQKLYEKFRGSNSHALVSLPFICTLN